MATRRYKENEKTTNQCFSLLNKAESHNLHWKHKPRSAVEHLALLFKGGFHDFALFCCEQLCFFFFENLDIFILPMFQQAPEYSDGLTKPGCRPFDWFVTWSLQRTDLRPSNWLTYCVSIWLHTGADLRLTRTPNVMQTTSYQSFNTNGLLRLQSSGSLKSLLP